MSVLYWSVVHSDPDSDKTFVVPHIDVLLFTFYIEIFRFLCVFTDKPGRYRE